MTGEPSGEEGSDAGQRTFVVQKHWASHLHHDFRLELDGTLKSWAVPKGPSLDPNDKRLAVDVEDHPIAYGSFEGTIPSRQYGAGQVAIWDKGSWEPVGNARRAYKAGNVKFELHGQKLRGQWAIHVVVPLPPKQTWEAAKGFSQAVARHLAATIPERFVAKSGACNRIGRIFVDYLRNGRDSTTVSAWSASARPGLGVSVPFAWEELHEIRAADQWTVANAHKRFAIGNEPWSRYASSARPLTDAIKALAQSAAPRVRAMKNNHR